LGDEEEVFKDFGLTINSSSSSTCNFVQATNKMKTTVAKPHPSVEKEDPPRKKIIPKDPEWNKKKRDNITIQAFGYGVDDHTKGSMQKRKITLFEGGRFSSLFHPLGLRR